jgi:hypothetical protein
MGSEFEAVDDIRTHLEPKIMAIQGVAYVGVGIANDGKHFLKIGTSVPPDEVRAKLPPEVFQVEVVIEYVGVIEAQ